MILVDTPNWPWRGRLWGHLVSDTSLSELHEFAQRIGKRRIGFQGDHYDIDAEEHLLAINEGAKCVDSRELVRRLRESGLRRRSKQDPWLITYQSEGNHPFEEIRDIATANITTAAHRDLVHEVLASTDSFPDAISVLVVERPKETAMVLEFLDPPLFRSGATDSLTRSVRSGITTVELIFDSSGRLSD